MDINNLHKDMIIKNYKELCTLLNIEAKGGNTKLKQLKELSIFCNYSKSGNKYIINEIYEAPVITIDDITKGKNSKYIKLLSNIIIEYLYNNPAELEQIPLLKLLSVLGITNNNYQSSNGYRKELSQLYDIQLASIYYFYSNTRREYKAIIERCLNNLQNRRVMNWNKCVIVIDKENKTTHKADEETQREILNMEKQTLQYLNINNMYELMKDKSKLKEFNKILKAEMGFEYYYAYDLIIGDIALKIEYENVQNEKIQLNNLIIDRTINIFDKPFYNSFQNDYKMLIGLLIDIDNKNDELKQILKDKHNDNIITFKNEALKANKTYKNQVESLRNTYLDNYK